MNFRVYNNIVNEAIVHLIPPYLPAANEESTRLMITQILRPLDCCLHAFGVSSTSRTHKPLSHQLRMSL